MRIKNWEKFQYRNPDNHTYPWIRLYRALLDDLEWFNLMDGHRGDLVMLWLLASEKKGVLPDVKHLAFRLRKSESEIKTLLRAVSHWIEDEGAPAVPGGRDEGAQEAPIGRPEGAVEEIRGEERKGEKTQIRACASNSNLPVPINPSELKPPSISAKRSPAPAMRAPAAPPATMGFILKFGQGYEGMTSEPFKAGPKVYPLVTSLIERYGVAALEKKAALLGKMCAEQSAWFTKEGWADFTIEKISTHWNSIIATYKETPEDKKRRTSVPEMAFVSTEDIVAKPWDENVPGVAER